jgi:hypothetical protein
MTPSGEPEVALTLVIPLRAKAGMSLPDFYQYWLNAHVTLPPRFPGISSIWLHVVSFDHQRWPRLPGVSHRPEPQDKFHGVPEATFPTMADLELFQSHAHVQMVDGINFLGEVITYASVGDHSATVVDKLDDAAPTVTTTWCGTCCSSAGGPTSRPPGCAASSPGRSSPPGPAPRRS